MTARLPATPNDPGVLAFFHEKYKGPDPKRDFSTWVHDMRVRIGAWSSVPKKTDKSSRSEMTMLLQTIAELELDVSQLSAQLREVRYTFIGLVWTEGRGVVGCRLRVWCGVPRRPVVGGAGWGGGGWGG